MSQPTRQNTKVNIMAKRNVQHKAMLAAVPGAVLVATDDGSSLVLAPHLARTIGAELDRMAHLAEDQHPGNIPVNNWPTKGKTKNG
jgi:hypothetical protein